jgi:transketolase
VEFARVKADVRVHAALDERSQALRRSIVDTLAAAQRGHIGAAFSIVEILRVLYDDVLDVDPAAPEKADRDRFILSKGHGCLALYAVLADKGFISHDEVARFCRRGGILGGHHEAHVPGIEASTGSLGHGLAIGVGMALHARMVRSPHRVFVLVGDGESNEGAIWEAALAAAKHRLSNLTVLVDYNEQQSYGTTHEVLELEPFLAKWESFGFAGAEVDGHDVAQLREVLATIPLDEQRPTAILCHTVKGYGTPLTERNLEWHHRGRTGDDVIRELLQALGG